MASTKYTISMQTVATDLNGDRWFSAVAKTSVTTQKFTAPSSVKVTGVPALSWKVNMKLDVYNKYTVTNDTIEFKVTTDVDNQGLPTPTATWATITVITAPDAKGMMTGMLAMPIPIVLGGQNKIAFKAVTTDKNVDGGAGVESLIGKATFKI
jgi:hypothetical protein